MVSPGSLNNNEFSILFFKTCDLQHADCTVSPVEVRQQISENP